MSKQLKLGIPKGSLESATIDLFKQAGWNIRTKSRHYFPTVNDEDLSCKLIKSKEMGPYVEAGVLDCGLTGQDWILESKSDVIEVCGLNYSKASNQACRWVLIVPQNSDIHSIEDLNGKTVATELTDFTTAYLKDRNIDAKVQFSWGATEAKVVEGLADAAVEITETGTTIKEHGLRIVEDLLRTHTVFVANKAAMEDPFKREKINNIALMLESAMAARQNVLLKMNAPTAALEKIVEALPSLQAPTVNHLHNQEWVAIETVVPRISTRELIPNLKAAGAEGILEVNLNKLVN
ncbi:MAG: ATP phosphoribosyltransferase [Saprospiraceae bacterium]|jgi:ATP phosphoribosyltransferase